MATHPMKMRGFSQGLKQVSATKREMLGTTMWSEDGRIFRYAKAGETLVAGGACIMAEATANHIKIAQTGVTNAKGKTDVKMLIGATAITVDQYADGYLQIYDGAAGTTGYQYQIVGNSVSSGSAIIDLTLRDPIAVATIATDTFSLIPNPWSSVIHTGTAVAHGFAGIAMQAATSGQYLWLQVGGPGIVKTEGTPAVGTQVGNSTVAQEMVTGSAYTGPNGIAYVYAYAGVDTKWCPVYLNQK